MGITRSQKEELIASFRAASSDPTRTEEAWLYAQTLTALENPTLYQHLTVLRRRIVQEIISPQIGEGVAVHKFIFKPISTTRKGGKSWKLVDITPEISLDPRMENIGVHGRVAKKLRQLIREQIWLLARFEH